MMFGNPDWFREKRFGWGLVPTSWRGWAYTAVWATVLVAPFFLLIGRGLVFEALIWLGFAMFVLIWDVREILVAKRSGTSASGQEEVLYIGEETPAQETLTRRFRFRWNR